MRRALLLISGAVLVLALAAPVLANNVWSGYHWADGSTDDHADSGISLTLVNRLTADYGYSAVVADWDRALESQDPLTFILLQGASDTRPDACDNDGTEDAGLVIKGKIHVCNDIYGETGWLGLARIWLSADGHIEAAVALMNDTYFLKDAYNDTNAKQHVLCQEIGHTFGLGHQGSPKKASCMNDRWGLKSDSFKGPNQHDFDMLNQIYVSGPTDGGDPVDKPCRGPVKKCGAGSNVHMAARAGGGWIVTYTFPVDRSLR